MRFLERMYRSPAGRVMSFVARLYGQLHKPFMIYGYYDRGSRKFRKFTRMSSNVAIVNEESLSVGDHVWVWHHSILDATEGLILEEGCQIGAWAGIFTHGSENSIRLLGKEFVHVDNKQRKGYTRGSVRIGAYTFIGAGSIVLPGVTIGKGCLIGTGSLVSRNIPDNSIVVGTPGEIKGSTLSLDKRFFKTHDFSSTYYDPQVLREPDEALASPHGTGSNVTRPIDMGPRTD
jgi:acetyltransferase-like isoleucine patch superfamily enzyme